MEVWDLDGVMGPHRRLSFNKDVRIPRELVKAMLGGKWPKEVTGYEGFCFESVDVYHIEDGRLVPYDGLGGIIPGPDFELVPIPGGLFSD